MRLSKQHELGLETTFGILSDVAKAMPYDDEQE